MMTDRNKKFAGKRLLRLKNCEGIRKTSESFTSHLPFARKKLEIKCMDYRMV